MKSGIILSAIAALALGSCSTAYRSGQTPDDVYYSPARERDAYVQVDNRSDNQPDYGRNYRNYDDRYDSYDDRWLRMRVRNRYRWSEFDDYNWNDYRYNTWTSNYYNPYSFNSYFNNYWAWNNYYNPYCPRVIIVNPKTNPVVYNKVRDFSLGSYTNTNYNNSRPSTNMKSNSRGIIRPSYNNTNTSSRPSTNNPGLGTSVRKVFGSSNSGRDTYSTPSSDRPTRTYTPPSNTRSENSTRSDNSTRSSSNSGSSGSSGSSGGGVSRPSRGGN